MRRLEKELQEWQQEGIINPETAEAILRHEKNRKAPGGGAVLVIFAVLGAILVALGISLMVAENWDLMNTTAKTAVAVMPMLLGQILVLTARFRYPDSAAWREAASAFLVLSVGATLGVISQTYHMQGSMSSFLWLWLLLILPVMWLTRSDTAFLITTGLTGWFSASLYFTGEVASWHAIWAIGGCVAYFVFLIAGHPAKRGIGIAAGVLLPGLLIMALGLGLEGMKVLSWMAYFGMFQLFVMLYFMKMTHEPAGWNAGLLVLGATGMLVLLYFGSYKSWLEHNTGIHDWPDFSGRWASLILFAVLACLYVFVLYKTEAGKRSSAALLPVYAVLIGLAWINPAAAQVLFNILILLIGAGFIMGGVRLRSLLLLNTGLVIFSILVVMRFFDFNLSFFVRGISFLLLGLAFFMANRLMLAAKKEDAE